MASLGDEVGHGPVLLGWMLGQLMYRGPEGLEASRQYGDTALSGGVSSSHLSLSHLSLSHLSLKSHVT